MNECPNIFIQKRYEYDTNEYSYWKWYKYIWIFVTIGVDKDGLNEYAYSLYLLQSVCSSHHQLLLPIHPNSLNLPQQPALLFIHKTNFTIHLQPISSKSKLNSKRNPASCEIHNVSFFLDGVLLELKVFYSCIAWPVEHNMWWENRWNGSFAPKAWANFGRPQRNDANFVQVAQG